MRRAGSVLILSTAFCLFTLAAADLGADDQSWINNSLRLTVNSRWNLKFTNELRYFDSTGLTPYLKNIQGGLVHRLPGNVYVALLYKRELTEKVGPGIHENRFTLESGWKTGVAPEVDLDIHLRTEVRDFDHPASLNHLRFRLRVRLKARVAVGSLALKPFIGTEPFTHDLGDKIHRNRFYLGTGLPLGENVEMVMNYIRQDT